MIEKFGDYMYYLLSTPYKQAKKEVNQWYLFFHVMGPLFDMAKIAFQTVRRESMVRTASPAMLPEHGFDRTLTRYEGESWENFRIRLMAYADTCLLGGTEVGTRLAVQALGFMDVQMIPCYKMDSTRVRWAEFFVIISRDLDDTFDIGHDIIRREVRKVKKVSAKDNYRFLYRVHDPQLEEQICLRCIVIRSSVVWYNNNVFDGTHYNDGKINHNNVISNHAPYIRIGCCVVHDEAVTVRCITLHHWRTNNGGTYNDGAKKFDAEKITEEEI